MSITCKKCTLSSSHPDVTFNDDGICSLCQHVCDDEKSLTKTDKNKLKAVLENKINSYRGSKPYDILVSYSGGTDSTYLLYLLKEEYGLNPLAFSFIHPVVSDVAKKNVVEVCEKLKVDLMQFHMDKELYMNFMSYGLSHVDDYNMGPDLLGCSFCSYLYKWCGYKMAWLLGVPCYADGSDKAQHGGWRFLPPGAIIEGDSVKKEIKDRKELYFTLSDIFDKAFDNKYAGSIYACDYESMKDRRFPDIIRPLQLLDYDSSKVATLLRSRGIVKEKDDLNFFLTNCSLGWFLSYISYNKFDCDPYDKTYAAEFRTGNFSMLKRIFMTGEKDDKNSYLNFISDWKKVLNYVAEHENIDVNDSTKIKDIAPLFYEKFASKFSVGIFPELLKQMKEMHKFSKMMKYPLKLAKR